MEPCIQTYFVHAWAGYHLSTMMRPRVAPAVVIVVPHDRPAYRGVDAKGFAILLARPIEASSTTAIPRGKAPVRLQVRKDSLQSTLATSALCGRVVMALVLLASRVAGGLQRLQASPRHPSNRGQPSPDARNDRVVLGEVGSARRAVSAGALFTPKPSRPGGLEACFLGPLDQGITFCMGSVAHQSE